MRQYQVDAQCCFKMLVIRHGFRAKVQIQDDCIKNVMGSWAVESPKGSKA